LARPPQALPLASVLTPNQTEAELLTGRAIAGVADALAAAEQLLAAGPHTVVRARLAGWCPWAGAWLAGCLHHELLLQQWLIMQLRLQCSAADHHQHGQRSAGRGGGGSRGRRRASSSSSSCC
jgi:hypothetical protein